MNGNIKKGFIFTLMMAFASCRHDGEAHLPVEKMKAVLFDISVAESWSSINRANINMGGAKNTDSLAYYYQIVLAHHKISPREFKESLNWYKKHEEAMDSLFGMLVKMGDAKISFEDNKLKK